MRLHLPVLLRKSLIAAFAATICVTESVQAGIRHSDVLLQTYTDFGQNKGRYAVGTQVNALLQYIRDTEGGIAIPYTDGQPNFIISNEQGMINFSGAVDGGPDVAIGPNFIATVAHNGSNSASYGERVVGGEHALNYQAIDIRGTGFRLVAPEGMWGPTHDYMLQRQSKVQTDVIWNPISSITDAAEMNGNYVYHSGGGGMGDWVDGKEVGTCGGYVYITGGIMSVTSYENYSDKGSFVVRQNLWYGEALEGASETHPLPNAVRGGDSGSPVYIYNAATGQYEYVGAQEGIAGNSHNWTAGNTEWTAETMESFNVHVDMSAVNTVYLNAIATQGDSISMDGYSTTIWAGAVTNAAGDSLASYKGVKTGLNTWNDLSDRKDEQNWYAYNASGGSGGYLNQSISDLFYNENLVFDAAEGGLNNSIVLKDTVDLGIGYAEFNGGRFTITSESGENNQFDHAGYVINEGAEVHLRLRNPGNRMTEWRKIGAGDLYIDGSGNTNALLNLGGTGTNYLQQQNGYAAYNVLANTGATVVIQDLNQIVRDFTFGAGGGTLDMHGNSMEWRTSSDAEGRFTINALTEDAMITNTSGNVTLTYTESGDTKYLGSFRDTKDAALTIDYQGGGTWELNSIHTDLSNNGGSGLIVSNGKVLFVGTHTVHGMGSLNGRGGARLELANDWHYADAAMNVTVRNGARFELGSHARLTGNIAVNEGGTFVMREGVQNRMEYVEGGVFLEDTTRYAAFYGLKGNIALAGNMRVEFNDGATSTLTYNGNISGAGSLDISLGTKGGILELGGDNSGFTGTKKIESGGVVLQSAAAMGDTSDNKWIVSSDGWIANHALSSAQLLTQVNEGSTGTLALSNDTAEQLDMSRHEWLTLGAASGRTVQYGEAGTQETLNAVLGAWRLGGAGGELVVNYKLSGANNLILGASGHSSGVVTLTNTQNDFSGDIIFTGSGIVLNTVDGALGNSVLNLVYGNAFGLTSADAITKNVDVTSEGMVTVDAVSNQQLDMSGHRYLAVAAEKAVEFSGSIALSAGQGYLFSSVTGGKLTLLSELDSSRSMVVDAQGLTGGTVVLAGNDSWSGDITVRGHRDNNGEGEISLQLGRDVAAGGTLTLAQGGILDLAGHNLSISGTIVTVGGQMKNSGSTGALIFDCSAHELTSTADLSVGSIRKIGSNMLSLGGNNGVCQFYVEEGTLRLVSDDAFTSGSTVHLGDGSTLDNRTHALLAGVSLENGTATLTSSNNNLIVVRGSVSVGDNSRLIIGKDGLDGISIDGDLSVGSGSSLAILSNSGASFTIGGNINLTEGTNLNFGNSANISLSGENIGTSGSSIVLNGGQLNLNKGGNISINSDLTINGNTTINSRGSADAMGRNFERVVINGGALTLWEESWSSVWNINSLEGSGNLHWQSTTNHNTSSRLILNGDGYFAGSISMTRTYRNNDRTHGAYLELASDFVASKADISLNGDAANAVATLAINTDNAHIKGLSGNQHSFVYAGASRVDTALSGSARPATTRAATLTIDADADYTFSGSIGNTADTRESGICLVKTGSGSQTINGASAVLNNVSALAGTLNISSSTLTVNGNVELACGAALKLGDSFSLNEGQNLSLLAGAENSGSAVLNSALVLNGGTISIDAQALSVSSPMLTLGGAVTMGRNFGGFCQLEFSNTSGVSMGTDYLVSTGDWSLLNNRISMANSDITNATFTASSTGLSVMFTLKDGFLLWEGEERILQSGNKVVFNGSNGHSTVNLTQDAALGTGYFNNAETVSISGATLSIGTLQKQDTGALQIDAEVSVGNMVVKDAITIGGEGSLTVGSLTLESDLTTRMAVQVDDDIQAQGAKWTVDGSNGNAFTQQLTLDQVNATGGMNVEGAATLEVRVEGGNQENPLTISGAVSGSGQVALVGGGSLEKNQQEHINLSRVELSNLVLKNGSTDITDVVNISERLAIGQETVKLLDGAQVTTSQFRMGDTAKSQPSTVTIEEGATLKVTGREDGDNTSASFLLAHWKSSFSTLVLNGGTINSENACLHMGWDSGARFEALTGEATLKGIFFSSERGNADTLVLGGARLNIGSGGITGIGSNDTVQLGNGTIAATASFSISGNKAIDLVGTDGGTTFDTAGHIITVNTVLQGEGSIIKTGSGTLNLAAANTFTGSLEVQAGTLQLSAAQNVGNYHMAEGTTLSITHAQGDVNIAALPNTITLSKNGSGVLNLGSAQLSALTLKGNGSTTISGDVNVAGKMDVGTESVVLADGAAVAVNQLRLGTSAKNQQSTLRLDAGSTLTVAGNVSVDAEGRDENISLLLAHWGNSASTLHLNGGTLNVQNASMHMGWDSGGTFRGSAGVANLHGVLFSSARGNADTFILEGARLNIGSGGISGIGSNDTVLLGSGTIAATANFTISGEAIKLTDEITGTTFDTNGHNITVNTAVNGSGRLVKEGEGALVLSSNALGILTTSSGIVVNSGKLDLTAAGNSANLARVSGEGTVVLQYEADGNGTAFDFSGLTGEVQVNSGRVLLNESTFGEECPDFRLTSSDSQLVFNGNGTRVGSNVILDADTTIHANDEKSGEIYGVLSGSHGLTKAGAGTLTFAAQNTYTGVTTIRGGKLILANGGDYTLYNSVTGGTLEVAKGTTLVNSGKSIASALVLAAGASAKMESGAERILTGDITVNQGAVLTFTGNSYDTIDYGVSKNLIVDGGTIDFGSTRQTMGGWSLKLSNGAIITGVGNETYGAIDFNNNNSTINVTSGENTISAVTRVRNGGNLNYNVSAGATLTVSGIIHSAGSSNKPSITKLGEGQMIVSSNLNLNYLSTRAGEVILTGAQNTVTNVDGAMTGGNTAQGTLRLAQDAHLQITGNIWGRSNTGIFLESGAELDISGKKLTIANQTEEGTASLVATTSTGPGEYTINQTKYEISNAHVTYTGGDATINNKLTNSSIENAGSGILKVNNAENTLIGVHATGGSIKLFSDAELDLKELEIATSLSVSAYSQLSEKAAQEARINVSGTADFGMGVTLNADLVMKSGATLKIAGSVDMGSDVRLETGLRLDGKLLNEVKVMQAGERIALFTGIDSLYFGDATEASSAFTLLDGVKAKDYFANLTDNYFLIYDTSAVDGEGTLSIELTVPEPTTTTLSLLALAALAARRRRK